MKNPKKKLEKVQKKILPVFFYIPNFDLFEKEKF
jgi:hypothetical protein